MAETSIGGEVVRFQPTPWTMVLRGDAEALEHLLRLYWKPIYFFLRRSGRDVETAKDLTQEFWATLLDRKSLGLADPARGRFRTFLLAALTNFLRDQARAEHRKMRVLPLDFAEAETRFRPSNDPPDTEFNRQWARTLLRQAVDELKPPYLDAVKMHLAGESRIAEKMGISESDAKNYVHRGRAQLREILIARIRETVDDPAQLDAEISEFLRAIR